MKKRTIILLILAALLLVSITACDTRRAEDVAVVQTTNFRPVEGRDDLKYDVETRFIFYLFNTNANSGGYQGYGYGYMAPYLSENGRYCKYINDQIIEYIPEEPTN